MRLKFRLIHFLLAVLLCSTIATIGVMVMNKTQEPGSRHEPEERYIRLKGSIFVPKIEFVGNDAIIVSVPANQQATEFRHLNVSFVLSFGLMPDEHYTGFVLSDALEKEDFLRAMEELKPEIRELTIRLFSEHSCIQLLQENFRIEFRDQLRDKVNDKLEQNGKKRRCKEVLLQKFFFSLESFSFNTELHSGANSILPRASKNTRKPGPGVDDGETKIGGTHGSLTCPRIELVGKDRIIVSVPVNEQATEFRNLTISFVMTIGALPEENYPGFVFGDALKKEDFLRVMEDIKPHICDLAIRLLSRYSYSQLQQESTRIEYRDELRDMINDKLEYSGMKRRAKEVLLHDFIFSPVSSSSNTELHSGANSIMPPTLKR